MSQLHVFGITDYADEHRFRRVKIRVNRRTSKKPHRESVKIRDSKILHRRGHSAHGRCDALVETDDYVYAFEFKRDRPAAEALAQIRERGYLTPFAGDEREVMGVGVSFDSAGKREVNYEVKEI